MRAVRPGNSIRKRKEMLSSAALPGREWRDEFVRDRKHPKTCTAHKFPAVHRGGVKRMIIARWHITTRFGHKKTAIDLMNKWRNEIGPKAGIEPDQARILTGSIGTPESEIQSDFRFDDLTGVQAFFDKLSGLPEHGAWGKEIEPFIVSGSNRFEILRELD
jgi:hypothetical protein